jgi:DNA repair protein RadB
MTIIFKYVSVTYINLPSIPFLMYVSTGSEELDTFLSGGYEDDVITTIYGPGGSGKTNLCLLCVINTVKKGKKVIYIDTEASFSARRMKQLDMDYEETLKSISFLRPTSFEEQKAVFSKLKDIVNKDIGLIVVDSIAMLYRLEFGKSQEIYEVNRDLGTQIALLTELARVKKIPVLITNQVYSSFDETDGVRVVGGDIMKYGSKCLLELKKGRANIRLAIIRKHRSMPEGKEFKFEIVEDGIEALED